MSVPLAKYNEAKRALSLAVRIDEVKDIRDKAEAMRVYAMQAKDCALIDHATELRLRAERRAGDLLRGMAKNQGAISGKTGRKGKPALDTKAKLSDLNINKSQSSRWQKLADLSDTDFEEHLANTKQKAFSAINRARQPKPKSKPKRKQPNRNSADIVATCISEVEMIVRAAMSRMDAEERADLFDQLEKAIHAITTEAPAQDHHRVGNGRADIHPPELDADRWTETH
jgi:hypothetical protein